ncbi:MAG TPA: hypothetical protein VFN87_10960, partial [Solirubrobacteraceae bacterium]|nr:hypothetical protein [Solirubrobacteraceae bacterium]
MIPGADVVAYPWQSDTVYAAEVDDDGVILRANPALLGAAGGGAGGRLCLQDLLSGEQRAAFARSLADAGERWRRAIFGFLIDGGAEDRTVWLRREPGRSIELVAEPAWTERDRLVGQVLALNDDLIATQRTLARRQRDLERAQDEAAHAARRVRQLEAILLAAITPREVDGALRSLLAIAQELLPGERADILLVDETTDRLVLRASAGEAASAGAATADAAVLASVATAGTSILIDDLAPVDGATGSL